MDYDFMDFYAVITPTDARQHSVNYAELQLYKLDIKRPLSQWANAP